MIKDVPHGSIKSFTDAKMQLVGMTEAEETQNKDDYQVVDENLEKEPPKPILDKDGNPITYD